MWKTPSKSTTTGISSARQDPVSQIPEGEEIPKTILQSQKYRHLYNRIHRSHQKSFKSIDQEEQEGKINKIRETISDKLKWEQKRISFGKKFSGKPNRSFNKIQNKGNEELIGVTKLIQSDRKLHNFLMDHRQAVELEEMAMLKQYYLKDEEKVHTKIDYLNKIQQTNKHQRLSPHKVNRQRMFMGKDYQYEKLRKTAQIKTARVITTAIHTAKKNPTYCRVKNFAQIQYINQEDNKNLIATSQVHSSPEQQEYRSVLIKIFLSVAKMSESLRVYYEYIEQSMFEQLSNLLIPQQEDQQITTRVNKQVLKGLINKIIQYKFNKVLHFEDFRELIETLEERYSNYSALTFILQKRPNILHNPLDKFYTQNRKQIQFLLNSLKIPVVINYLYEKQYKDHIVAKKYLPVNTISQILRDKKILPKIVTMAKFAYVSLWNKRRREGLDSEEFMKLLIFLGLSLDCSVDGIRDFLELFNPQQLLM